MLLFWEVDILKIEKQTLPDEHLIEQLKELESKCNSYDNIQSSLCIDVSLNYYKEMNSIFLFYFEEKLVSFIAVFAPLKHEIEICGFTDPSFRQRGYFRALLKEVIEEARRFKIKDILFVFDGKFSDAKKIGEKLNAKLYLTEYYLSYAITKDKCEKNINNSLVLKKVDSSNELPLIVELEKEIFKEDEAVALSLSKSVLVSSNRAQYVGYYNKKAIGLISVEINKDEAIIFGLGIIKDFRGKGHAKDMLCILMHELNNKDIVKISLEVDSRNPSALGLYLSYGFERVHIYEYFRLNLDAIK